MCGISGFLGWGRQPADEGIARRMTATLRHRGPDDEGYYVAGPVALGHRRLRVIDLATGRQPLSNEDGTVWAMLNGEIYNYRELRETLLERGHRFTTASDTEVIVHAWEDFGEACVEYFNGMFALALWDARSQVLLLARDRMGEKPLYYAEVGDALVFGSELRALLAHPSVARELDLTGFASYMTSGYVVDPHTIVRGVQKLPPGHLLTASGTKTRLSRYWDIPFPHSERRGESEWAALVWDGLCGAVRRRLVADVPVGVFLSGGLDSSAIVAATATVAPTRKLATFSMGFTEATYDETRFAREVARRFGTEHHEFVFTAANAAALLPSFGHAQDEPLADPAFLPTLELARQTRTTATVLLDGDGGDELFCGYPTSLAMSRTRLLDRLPDVFRDAATRIVTRVPRSTRYGSIDVLLRQLFRAAGHPPDVRTQILMGGFTPTERHELLSDDAQRACGEIDAYSDVAGVLADAPAQDELDRLIYHHAKLYLAGRTLVKMDRATMAFGLEARAPYLDHEFVELACSVPSAFKLKGWTTKYLLKRMMADRLPASIVYRRKQGFGVPLAQWLRGPLRPFLEDVLHADRLRRIGLFSPRAVARLVAEHVADKANHASALWTLMSFELWRDAYLPGLPW
ncbi:MAG TPA: asparagine synthase (glutamine-hydrolyzing) [Methylomirabilota bacterium]